MPVHIEKLDGIAFLAFPDTLDFLKTELSERFSLSSLSGTNSKAFGEILYIENTSEKRTDLFLSEQPYWARTTLLEPFLLHFESIGDAAKALKEIQRNWAPYQYQSFRRAALIQEKLPYINLKAKNFPFEIPKSPIGVYTLIDDKTILASAKTSSFLPAGKIEFVEDHENPPSRAYLKIQESLTLARHFFGVPLPGPDSRCFEAGACPGGWTWVLVNLGAKVYAVDRAELAPSLMQNPLVEFCAHDAFTLKPEEIGKCDWVFSDVICYPERLLEWVKKWLDSGLTKKMICTIKMQGAIDYEIVKKFAEIPDSRVVHLNYNKHELTWIHAGE
ncbi:MAG: SAM-dependent methyltransferase [Treponema sp.]|nr:SAM-dependent methyltransferase [Treponema sp.]